MKKNIQLLVFLLLTSFACAQQVIPVRSGLQTPSEDSRVIAETTSDMIQERVMDVDVISISSVSNIFTILNVAQNQVHYVPEFNALSFVHRQDIGEFPEGGSGTVRYDISMDQGANWTIDEGPLTPDMVSTNSAVPITTPAGEDLIRGCRYPNGLIFNPMGNSDMNNAYYVSVGPALYTDFGDDVGWGANYFASSKLDGTSVQDFYMYHLGDDIRGSVDGLITTLVQGGNAVYAMSAGGVDVDVQLIWRGRENTFNTGIEWDVVELYPDWKLDNTGNIVYTGYQNMAFSADGSIGYAVFGGATTGQVDSLYIPIVYETTDQGETWQLASDDFEMGYTEVGLLLSSRPYLRNFDCVVDADNNLRLFGEVMQLSEDYTGFFYEGYLVEYIWDGLNWQENLIGVIDDSEQGVFQGNFQDLYAHPQASISGDRQTMIYSWLTTLDGDVNIQPDILARGVSAESGYMTEIKNLTLDSDAEEFAYYATSSPVLISDGTEFDYELPTVVFLDWSGDNLDPVQLYYLKGMGFDDSEFVVGVGLEEEENPLNSLLVYPNPANDLARVSFALEQGMTIQIRVLDATGRAVISGQEKDNIIGPHTYDIDLSALDSGHYIIEIQAGQKIVTRKLQVLH